MKRFCLFIVTLSTVALSACYSPDRGGFSKFANSLVAIGDRFTDAETKLKGKGFACIRNKSIPPSVSCTRQRGSILYSCVEHVYLSLTSDDRVSKVEVPKIVCAGL